MEVGDHIDQREVACARKCKTSSEPIYENNPVNKLLLDKYHLFGDERQGRNCHPEMGPTMLW